MRAYGKKGKIGALFGHQREVHKKSVENKKAQGRIYERIEWFAHKKENFYNINFQYLSPVFHGHLVY